MRQNSEVSRLLKFVKIRDFFFKLLKFVKCEFSNYGGGSFGSPSMFGLRTQHGKTVTTTECLSQERSWN